MTPRNTWSRVQVDGKLFQHIKGGDKQLTNFQYLKLFYYRKIQGDDKLYQCTIDRMTDGENGDQENKGICGFAVGWLKYLWS